MLCPVPLSLAHPRLKSRYAGRPASLPVASRLPVLRTRAQEPHPRQKIDCKRSNQPSSTPSSLHPSYVRSGPPWHSSKSRFPGTPLDARRRSRPPLIHTTLRKQQANLPQAHNSCTPGSSVLPSAHFISGMYSPTVAARPTDKVDGESPHTPHLQHFTSSHSMLLCPKLLRCFEGTQVFHGELTEPSTAQRKQALLH